MCLLSSPFSPTVVTYGYKPWHSERLSEEKGMLLNYNAGEMVERTKRLMLDEVKPDYLLEALVVKLKLYVWCITQRQVLLGKTLISGKSTVQVSRQLKELMMAIHYQWQHKHDLKPPQRCHYWQDKSWWNDNHWVKNNEKQLNYNKLFKPQVHKWKLPQLV